MTKKEAIQILAVLKASYPNFYKDMSAEEAQGTVSVWSMQFADMSADIVLMALNKAISTSKYPPSVAEVKSKISSVHWEAYEVIEQNYSLHNLTDEELKTYQRIYNETQPYKFRNNTEPKISNMLIKNDVKKLGVRNDEN